MKGPRERNWCRAWLQLDLPENVPRHLQPCPLRLSRALQAGYRTYAQLSNYIEDDIIMGSLTVPVVTLSRGSYRRNHFKSPTI